MSTRNQATTEAQQDPDGVPLPSQIWVPGQSSFALPGGSAYQDDGKTGWAIPWSGPPIVPFSEAQRAGIANLNGLTSPQTITIGAPGAGSAIFILGVHIGINNTAAELINVTFPSNLGGQILRCASTTTAVGELDWVAPNGAMPQNVTNTSAVFSVSGSPSPFVASPDVVIYYIVRPAT